MPITTTEDSARIDGHEAGKQAIDILRRVLKSDRIMYWALSSEDLAEPPEFVEARKLLKLYDRPVRTCKQFKAARKEALRLP